ncbi:MAG TPA: hypothetical protein VFQ88_13275 [Nevskiaceae bacterium]|nr:hypothetical protein [Nevskiaceae bacterium]
MADFLMSQNNDNGHGDHWMHTVAAHLKPPRPHSTVGGPDATMIDAPGGPPGPAAVSVAELRRALEAEMESLEHRSRRLAISLSPSAYGRATSAGRPASLARVASAFEQRALRSIQRSGTGEPSTRWVGRIRQSSASSPAPTEALTSPWLAPRSVALSGKIGDLLRRLQPTAPAVLSPFERHQAREEADPGAELASPPAGETSAHRRCLSLQRSMAQDELALRRQVYAHLRRLPAGLKVPATHHSLGAFIKQPAFARWLATAESHAR